MVSITQQFSVAESRITTPLVSVVCAGEGLDVGWCFVAFLVVAPVCEAVGAAGDADTKWYTTKPTIAASASAMAALQFGRRRSRILIGVAGSKTSAAEMARGAPCVWSYSLMSGSGSTPAARATLRMCPRA